MGHHEHAVAGIQVDALMLVPMLSPTAGLLQGLGRADDCECGSGLQ